MRIPFAVLALLFCPFASGQLHRLDLPADGARPACGEVQLIGAVTALIRCGGITVLADPEGESPDADLVLLAQPAPAIRKLGKARAFVASEAAAPDLSAPGFHNVHALRTWEAMEVFKGGARLRITAMPGRGSTPGMMLDFSGEGSYRIYISGDALAAGDLEEIPRRFPGADLALLQRGGRRLFGVMPDRGRGARMLQLKEDAAYRFRPVKR
ncbi:MBL fold metallo-hydrolase [Massilia endophytica]|uniref:MBL fold metallo-hydrolase n=1 Tax=Massilia endophytica TaxID=2899220 RepID=UPI001E405C82|nr:hypothetical protein [Massilia endophytica]UGQ46009.1 hypothetical protein LSQ66_19820 [Massilia endophytica]